MFAILIPSALLPLILTLFWGERQAKRRGLVAAAPLRDDLAPPVKTAWVQRMWLFSEQLDLVGIVLLGAAVFLILLPMTLNQRGKNSWSDRTSPSFTS